MALPELNVSQLDRKRAAHLLRRATFGATREQINAFSELSPQVAVESLFRTSLPDPVLPTDPLSGQEWFSGITPPVSEEDELEQYFLGWLIAQMMSHGVDPSIALPYSAREKVVFFLHTHFTTIRSKVASSKALYFQNQLLRVFALDDSGNDPQVNFKNLTVKISVDNAMLRLLDGNLNVRGSVNENYARELLELYSIGRGLEGTLTSVEPGDYVVYKEQDVRAAAAVLTGWDFDDTFENIDPDTNLPRGIVKGSSLNASAHDNDLKQFSERMGNNTISGDPLLMQAGNPTETSAINEISQLIDLIYANPETARNICRKIYRFYVWAPHTLEEATAIENTVIEEMASTFAEHNFKIQPVIENLLRSEHFYEAGSGVTDDSFGGLIKSPLDLTVGALRFFNIQLPDMATDAVSFYEQTNEIISSLENMGMKFFEPYDVAGYEAYHQYPVYHRFWITPNALTQRYNFIRTLITMTESGTFNVNIYEYVRDNFPAEAPDANALVMALAQYLFPVFDPENDTENSLTTQRLNYFKNALLGGFDEAYWTDIWNGTNIIDKRMALENLFNAMLQSPEYQLA